MSAYLYLVRSNTVCSQFSDTVNCKSLIVTTQRQCCQAAHNCVRRQCHHSPEDNRYRTTYSGTYRLTELVVGVAVFPRPSDPVAVFAVGGQPLERRKRHVVPVAEVDVGAAAEEAVAPRPDGASLRLSRVSRRRILSRERSLISECLFD